MWDVPCEESYIHASAVHLVDLLLVTGTVFLVASWGSFKWLIFQSLKLCSNVTHVLLAVWKNEHVVHFHVQKCHIYPSAVQVDSS